MNRILRFAVSWIICTLIGWGIGPGLNQALQAQCINTFPYIQDFESGPAGWAASSITPAGTGPVSWVRGNPANPVINSAFSGTNAWITGNSPFTSPPYSYFNNEFSAVTSPCFDLSSLSNPAVSMMIWWNSEFSFDGAVFQASTDGGTSWQTIGDFLDQVNWYNDNSVNGGTSGGPGGQGLGWTGRGSTGNGSNGWVPAQHLLPTLIGQTNVLFRIAFASDFSSNDDGFAFDDFIIADAPLIDLGNDTTICFADTVILDACIPTALSYEWNTSPIDTFCTKIAVSTFQYVVTVEDTLGFIVKDTMNLLVSGTQAVLPPDQLICPGDTILLNAGNPTANHLWLPLNTTTQSIKVFETGTYKIVISDSLGCVETDSIDIAVDFVPDVDLGSDTTICIGESLELDASAGNPGTTYLWNFGSSTTQTVIVSAPGQYKVVVTTAFGCVTSDSMNLGVELAPVVDLGADRIECDTFTLNANNPGSSFLWSNGDTTQTLISNLPGTYWVNVSNIFGCEAADTVMISPGSVPVVNLGLDQIVCNGSTVTLDAGYPNFEHFWSTGDTSQSITIGQAGLYVVQVTSGDGCVGYDSVEVIQSPLTVNLGPDITACENDTITLLAGFGGAVYNWSTGDNTPSIATTGSGPISVTVIDSSGCMASDNINIARQTNFMVDFSGPDSSELYEIVQFTGQSSGSPTSWFWEFGDGITSTQQNPDHTYQSINTFTVCLTVSDGICSNTTCKDIFIDIFEVNTGIAKEVGLDLSIFPNPNSGAFEVAVSMEKLAELNLSLFDLSGKELYREEIGTVFSHISRVNQPNLPAGLYLLKLSIDNAAVYRKVMIR